MMRKIISQGRFNLNPFLKPNKRFFSSAKERTIDLFESNLKIENIPDHISTYSDHDMTFATEVLRSIDLNNLSTLPLVSGRFSRMFCLIEDTIHHFVMFLAHDLHLGMGMATIILAILSRLIFVPVNLNNMKRMKMMKKLEPELAEFKKRIKALNQARESKLALMERRKMFEYQAKFIPSPNPFSFALNILQFVTLGSWACLVQRFAFRVEDYPEMLTGGFLWFKDLSQVDPYFILPLMTQFMLLLVTHTNDASSISPVMLKMRRFLFVLPFVSLPIMCTLEAGFVLYTFTIVSCQYAIQYFMVTERGKKFLNIPEYIPGTKLEKLNEFKHIENIMDVYEKESQVLSESVATPEMASIPRSPVVNKNKKKENK